MTSTSRRTTTVDTADSLTRAEGLLPDRDRGYDRGYTVETPGPEDRGARRIRAGSTGEFHHTDDHYESLRRIAR